MWNNIENQVNDITHFLYADETTHGTYKDCQDTFPLYDAQTPIQKQTVTKTHAKTLCKQNIFEKLKQFDATHKILN